MLWLLVGLWAAAQVHRVAIASYLGASSLMADFGITAAGAGLLAAVYFPAYGLVQVPSGIMSDVLRPRLILVGSALLFALASLLFAFSPTFEMALGARILVGITAGFLWLPALKLASGLPGVSYPRAISLIVSVGSLGTIAGLAALPALVAIVEWRLSTAMIALPLLVVALLVWLMPAPPVEPSEVALRERVRQSVRGLGLVLRDRRYWRIFLPSMMWNSGHFALLSWLPRYARDVLVLPPAAVGLLPALLPIGLMVGSWGVGLWLQRRPHLGMRPFYASVVLWSCLLALLASGLVEPLGAAGLYAVALVLGLVYGAWFMAQAETGRLAGPRLLGTATGVVNGLGFLPAFVYPWLMGVAMDLVDGPTSPAWSYSAEAFRAGFLIVLAGAILGLLGGLALSWRRGLVAGG